MDDRLWWFANKIQDVFQVLTTLLVQMRLIFSYKYIIYDDCVTHKTNLKLQFKTLFYFFCFVNLLYLRGKGGGSLGFRSWKMSLSIWLIEGVMVVI